MSRAVIGPIVLLLASSGIVWGQPDEKPPAESKSAAAPARPAATAPQVTTVFSLKYLPVSDLCNTLREVVDVKVVAEPAGNRLIVIASAGKTKMVQELIEQLDRPPAMVVLQVMIAELKLHGAAANESKDEESDAPAAGDEPAKSTPTSNEELKAKLHAAGLDLSASGDELAKQIRGLQQRGRLELLNHARLTTLDNQPAFLTASEGIRRFSRISRAASSSSYENVGLTIGVTPRVNTEGVVTMEIDVKKSWLGSGDKVSPAGDPDAGPVTDFSGVKTANAQSTVSLPDGETIVLGKLISESGTQAEELVILVRAEILRPGASANHSSAGEGGAVYRYALSLLGHYDANKNGVLEKDEWSKMRTSYEKADRNRDGVITIEELTSRLAEYSRGSSSSGNSSSGSHPSPGEGGRLHEN